MGWMELLVVGVVALIVVGPKDLPVMFQSLGKMTAKIKRMAREFQGAMNEAANATGAADISKDLKGLTSPKALGIDKLKDAADSFDKWDPGISSKPKPAKGPETEKLSKERAEAAEKIRKKSAEVAQARLDREKAEKVAEDAAETKPKPKSSRARSNKPAAKTTKPATKRTTKPRAPSGTAAKGKPATKRAAKPKAADAGDADKG